MARMACLFAAFALSALAFIVAAHDEDRVVSLPGQPQVNFKQYAGQILVDKGRYLFYWFFEADHPKAESLPVTLWLNGGPGCSSVGNGALDELGPFRVNKNGDGLELNEYSWTKVSNLIFLESPAGVGYGYTANASDILGVTDARAAKDNIEFLLRWFEKFPQYKTNDFYVTGESYAGHYIPTLAMAILDHNKMTGHSHASHSNNYLNFKGFAIGNAWTDIVSDNLGAIDFYYTHSVISEATYNALINCSTSTPVACIEANLQADIDLGNINEYYILGDAVTECVNHKKVLGFEKIERMPLSRRFAVAQSSCMDHIKYYLNLKSVQEALHVKHPRKWESCNFDLHDYYNGYDFEKSMLPHYGFLTGLENPLKIWVYSGDMDGVVPTLGTKFWLKKLGLPIKTPWFPWNSTMTRTVGGWAQVYDGLTFVTIRGAGHFVPKTEPLRALELFQAFLADKLPAFNTN